MVTSWELNTGHKFQFSNLNIFSTDVLSLTYNLLWPLLSGNIMGTEHSSQIQIF